MFHKPTSYLLSFFISKSFKKRLIDASVGCNINILTIVNDDHMFYLFYKHAMALARVINYALWVINYAPRVMLQIVASLTDYSRGIIYNSNMFIVQATVQQ